MHDDEFTGQGGSYILDPETGIRTRVEEPTQGTVRPADTMPPRGASNSDAPASPTPRRARTNLVTRIEEVAK